MKIVVAAIQMPSDPLDVPGNLQRADDLLRAAHARRRRAGRAARAVQHRLQPLPRFRPVQRDGRRPDDHASPPTQPAVADGDRRRLRRARRAATSTIRSPSPTPTATSRIYRKRNLVFWERFRFRPGRAPLVVSTPWGRVGFAICADMIYRKVWDDYRDRIDLAVVSAAWPNFANRDSGRRHWLLGHVGPALGVDPGEGRLRPGDPGGLRQPVRRDPHHDPGPLHADQGPVRRPEQHLRRPARRAGASRRRAGAAGRSHHPPSQRKVRNRGILRPTRPPRRPPPDRHLRDRHHGRRRLPRPPRAAARWPVPSRSH